MEMPAALATISFCAAFLLVAGLNWLALIPWRRSAGKHWTERARRLYPVRNSARLNAWLVPANLGLLSHLLFPETNFLFAAIPGFAGGLLGGFYTDREIFSGLEFKHWLHLISVSWFLFFGQWAVLIFTAVVMPRNFGIATWSIAGAVLALLMGLQFGLGLRLLRWLRLLRPAPERLQFLVADTSRKMNVPVRSTWTMTTFVSNAGAVPLTHQLIFTEKLLATLSDEEVQAVCAHELGHLIEPRKVLLVRVMGSIAFYPLIFARPFWSLGDFGPATYSLLVIGVLLLRWLSLFVARRMETRADKVAVESQTDSAVYARALERIYETNHTPAVLRQTYKKIHPDLYDRMLAAGIAPDFPKPNPPHSQSWPSIVMLIMFIVIAVCWVM